MIHLYDLRVTGTTDATEIGTVVPGKIGTGGYKFQRILGYVVPATRFHTVSIGASVPVSLPVSHPPSPISCSLVHTRQLVFVMGCAGSSHICNSQQEKGKVCLLVTIALPAFVWLVQYPFHIDMSCRAAVKSMFGSKKGKMGNALVDRTVVDTAGENEPKEGIGPYVVALLTKCGSANIFFVDKARVFSASGSVTGWRIFAKATGKQKMQVCVCGIRVFR